MVAAPGRKVAHLRIPGHGKSAHGFTLIELMIVVVIVAILAAIALPAYGNYVKKSRAKSAGADLVTLSLNFENSFQRSLVYPAIAATDDVTLKMPGWTPSQGGYFSYTATSSATANASGVFYTLTATGSGAMSGCNLTLNNLNARTIDSASTCGGLGSW
jgi:type IV pilus assembly protein PilE